MQRRQNPSIEPFIECTVAQSNVSAAQQPHFKIPDGLSGKIGGGQVGYRGDAATQNRVMKKCANALAVR